MPLDGGFLLFLFFSLPKDRDKTRWVPYDVLHDLKAILFNAISIATAETSLKCGEVLFVFPPPHEEYFR